MFSIYRSKQATLPLQQTWELADEALQQAILAASHRINQQLQVDPLDKGESRAGNRRILIEAPLGVVYVVDTAAKVVHILRTWAYTVKAQEQDRVE